MGRILTEPEYPLQSTDAKLCCDVRDGFLGCSVSCDDHDHLGEDGERAYKGGKGVSRGLDPERSGLSVLSVSSRWDAC